MARDISYYEEIQGRRRGLLISLEEHFPRDQAAFLASLVGQASRVSPIQQANGNLAYIVNAGREVGVSRLTGLPTEFYTVITRGDELLTAFPGFPR